MAVYVVTGAAGFIAARVAEMLIEQGHSVIGVDNLNDAYDVRLKEYRLKRLIDLTGEDEARFSFRHADISQRATLESLARACAGHPRGRVEAVFNLAARAGVRSSVENPWVYVDANVTGTVNMLELCRRLDIPKFILASTSSIYGSDAPLPTPEDWDSSHPLQPYAATKKGAEVLCHAYHHLNDLDVTVFRYFTVYGPAGRPDMSLFRFTQWISEGRPVIVNGDGEQSRGITYVDDIAQGTILGLKRVGYDVINLGGHESAKINDLIRMLEERIGRRAELRFSERHPADMLTSWANVEKARRILGWQPHISIAQGLDNLVTWYNAERVWASQIKTG